MNDNQHENSQQCLTDLELSQFDIGIVDADRLETISRHLDTCKSCTDRFEQLEQQADHVLERNRVYPPPPNDLAADSAEFDRPTRTARTTAPAAHIGKPGDSDPPTTMGGSLQTRNSDVTSSGAIAIRRVDDYEIINEIARGGMGVVYKAWDKELKCHVALKTIRSGELAGQQEIERFHREAESAAHLQHPGIVRVHRFGQHGGLHYFTMDYVDGQSLDMLTRDGPLDIETAVGFAIEICEAVEFAHLHGILHRDLKPANVLISNQSGRALVSDFGLAKRMEEDSDFTQTGQAIGTPAYMPPEQAEGRKHDVNYQSDVYAIGALLYHLLGGSPPFTGRTHREILNQVVNDVPTPPSKRNPLVGSDLNTVCLKCLEKDPIRRYMSAAELRDDLRRYSQGFPVQARPVTAIQRGWRWCRRNRLVASLGLLISIIMMVVFSLVISLGQSENARLDKAKKELDDEINDALYIGTLAHDVLIRQGDLHDSDGLRVALEDYEELRSAWWSSASDADIQMKRRSAEALFRVAQANRLLGQFSESETNFLEAIRVFDTLRMDGANDPNLAIMQGKSLDYLGELYREYGSNDDADERAAKAYSESLAVLQKCVAEFPHPEARMELARTENNYGIFLHQSCQYELAKSKYDDSKRRLQELVDGYQDDVDYRRDFARTLINVGVVARMLGQPHEAESSYNLAIKEFRFLLTEHPNNGRYGFLLALTKMNLGYLRQQNREFALAEGLYNESLSDFRSLPTDHIPEYRFGLAKCLINLATLHGSQGELDSSSHYFVEAESELLTLLESHSNVSEFESWTGRLYGNLGWMADQNRDYDRFATNLKKAIAHQQNAANLSRYACEYDQKLMGHHRFFALQILDNYLDEDSASRKAVATEQIVAAIEHGYRTDFSPSRFDAIRDAPQFKAATSTLSP